LIEAQHHPFHDGLGQLIDGQVDPGRSIEVENSETFSDRTCCAALAKAPRNVSKLKADRLPRPTITIRFTGRILPG
jgi:hypothetical protein